MDLLVWGELTLFVVLLGFSAFFSSSETALFSISNVQLEQLRRDGHPRATLIGRMLSEPRRLIITILIGNELVNVAASVISAVVIIKLFGADKKFINLLVMVPVLLLVGEITPKTFAVRHNIAFANVQCGPIEAFARMITPLRWLVRLIAEWFITLIVGRERSQGNIITADLLRTLAHEAVGEGTLDRIEAQFIDHIFDFGNKTVEDVMTPRSDILFLPVESTLSDVVVELRRTWRTRIPIYRDDRDHIIGVLHARDLLGGDLEAETRRPDAVERLCREAYFVPETKLAAELFHNFRKRKLSVALVVDEYGGVTGLVTMEDLLECIFGDIHSPSDKPRELRVRDLGDGRFTTDGIVQVAAFNQETGSSLPTEHAETLGGLLLHHCGELPPEGAELSVGGLSFTIDEVMDNRVKTVIWRREGASDTGGEDTSVPEPGNSAAVGGKDGVRSPPHRRCDEEERRP